MESNDNIEQLLKQMYSTEEENIDTSEIIDEEWAKFEAEHFGSKRGNVKREKSPLLKIAAMIIGVLVLSGITYAAIRIVRSNAGGAPSPAAQEVSITDSRQHQDDASYAVQDTTQMKPVVYENAELGTILREMAAYYRCDVVYKNLKARNTRLFFTWDKRQSLDDVVEMFNKFERFNIKQENGKLIVE